MGLRQLVKGRSSDLGDPGIQQRSAQAERGRKTRTKGTHSTVGTVEGGARKEGPQAMLLR